MVRLRVHLRYPESLVSEPLIYRIGQQFDVVTSIRRANIEEGVGWVILDLVGGEDEVEDALEWLRAQGIAVEVIERGEPGG